MALLAVLMCLIVGPSWALDCATSQWPDEREACKDYTTKRTVIMPGVLRSAVALLPAPAAAALQAEQGSWQARLPDGCDTAVNCLVRRLDARIEALRRIADTAPGTQQACAAIAVVADRGAPAVKAADMLERNAPIDLENDGHPKQIQVGSQGSAAYPYIAGDDGQPKTWGYRDDYLEDTRFASEISALRVGGRVWVIAWERGRLDGTVVLTAATDSGAVCHFHAAWQPPAVRTLSRGERQDASTYQELLLGNPEPAPSAVVDTKQVEANSKAAKDWSGHVFGPRAYSVDLAGTGKPMILIEIEFIYGGGRGCQHTLLGVVHDGRVADYGPDLDWPLEDNSTMPMSPELKQKIAEVGCAGVTETPVLDKKGRAYILFANTAPQSDSQWPNRIRLLAAMREGMLQSMARLVWRVRNEVVPPIEH